MSAEGALHAALTTLLAGAAGLNRVEPGAAVRVTPPYAEIGPIMASDWGTKDAAGRELRVTVTIRDAAERAARLHGLSDAVQAAIEEVPRELADPTLVGGGWRVASLAFVKSRVASDKAGLWAAVIEYRVRVLAAT